jgi:hypothetical protein
VSWHASATAPGNRSATTPVSLAAACSWTEGEA